VVFSRDVGSQAFERARVTLEALQRREIIDALEKLITVLERSPV
jgi:hypothetical protein